MSAFNKENGRSLPILAPETQLERTLKDTHVRVSELGPKKPALAKELEQAKPQNPKFMEGAHVTIYRRKGTYDWSNEPQAPQGLNNEEVKNSA